MHFIGSFHPIWNAIQPQLFVNGLEIFSDGPRDDVVVVDRRILASLELLFSQPRVIVSSKGVGISAEKMIDFVTCPFQIRAQE